LTEHKLCLKQSAQKIRGHETYEEAGNIRYYITRYFVIYMVRGVLQGQWSPGGLRGHMTGMTRREMRKEFWW